MSETFEARVIRVEFETGETGRIYADSPDLRGLMIGRRSMSELEAALPQAIADLFAAKGQRVSVSRVADGAISCAAWVAVPFGTEG